MSKGGQEGLNAAQRVPHYAQPTTVSVLPAYANDEQDTIRNAFQAGNFRQIKMLPNEIKTNYVNEARANHVDSNITSAIVHAPYGSYRRAGKDGNRGLFHEFEYIPSPYNLADDLKAKEMAESRKITEEVGGKPFAYTSHRPELRKPEMDYEHELEYRDPYDESQNVQLREKWLEKSKILDGPFAPSSGNQALRVTNRACMPDIMRGLAREIDQDWEDAEFQIFRDEEDLVVVEFNIESLDSEKGLLAYMNMLTQTNEVVSENGLSKVVELWNHYPNDGSVYYAFKPPWVKRRTTDSYYTLYPERRNFRALKQMQMQMEMEKEKEEMAKAKAMAN